MHILIVLLASLGYTLQGASLKEFNTKHAKNSAQLILFSVLFCFLSAALSVLFSFRSLPGIHSETFTIGIVYGLLYGACAYFYFTAVRIGPLSLSSLFLSMGLILPVIYSLAFLNEALTFLKLLGILLVFATLLIASGVSKQKEGGASVKWFVCALTAMLTQGILSTLQKYHQVMLPGQESLEFITIGYIAAIFSASIFFLTIKLKTKAPVVEFFRPRVFVIGGLAAVGSVVGNALMTYLAGHMEGSILYPVGATTGIIFIALVALLLFKEKFDRRKILSIAIGTVAVVILSLQ